MRSLHIFMMLSKLDAPSKSSSLLRTAASVIRSRQGLVLENLALRHQIQVLQRSVKQPQGGTAEDRREKQNRPMQPIPAARGGIRRQALTGN